MWPRRPHALSRWRRASLRNVVRPGAGWADRQGDRILRFPGGARLNRKSVANPNLESLIALRPELIVAPRGFSRANVLAKLEELKIPVLLLDATSLESIFRTFIPWGASSIAPWLRMP